MPSHLQRKFCSFGIWRSALEAGDCVGQWDQVLVFIRHVYRASNYLFLYIFQTGVFGLPWDLHLKKCCMMCMTFLPSYWGLLWQFGKSLLCSWCVLSLLVVSMGWVNICSVMDEFMLNSTLLCCQLWKHRFSEDRSFWRWTITVFISEVFWSFLLNFGFLVDKYATSWWTC